MIDRKYPEDVVTVKTTIKPGMTLAQQKQMKLAEKKFKYERELDAANEAEFKSGIDFYLDRNLKHVKDMRADKLFDKDKIKTKKAADKIAALLSEGSAYSYKAVKNKDGDYVVEDAAGEVVTGANTPVGLLDLLNQGTIYAQLETPTDKTAAAKYVASKMGNINIRTQAELEEAYNKLNPGESIIVNGVKYTKPKQ